VSLSGTSPNQTVSLNVMRSAMALDRFNKMRAWYGDKYVDYLKALGVEVEWSLLMEPEVIGRKHQDWRFQRTSQTVPVVAGAAPQNTVGQMAGMFYTDVKLPIKRTFSPEHGLIAVYGCTRADGIQAQPPQPPVLCKAHQSAYWSPEYESIIGAAQNGIDANPSWAGALTKATFVADPAVAERFAWHNLQFDEYRTGLNYNRTLTNGPQYGLVVDKSGITTDDKYVALVQNNYASNFTQATTQQYQACAEYRLTRHSPVKRIDLRLKLS